VSDQDRPHIKLKSVRARAKSLFDQLDECEAAREQTERSAPDEFDDPFGVDQLNLFLRSLNSHLKSAISEVRASSEDLANLAAEVKRVELRLGQGN
jgi:hypothetical protein